MCLCYCCVCLCLFRMLQTMKTPLKSCEDYNLKPSEMAAQKKAPLERLRQSVIGNDRSCTEKHLGGKKLLQKNPKMAGVLKKITDMS